MWGRKYCINFLQLKNIFTMILRDFDVDLTGTLSKEELKTGINSKPEYIKVIKKHRDISDNKEAKKYWNDMDPNDDDVITEEEFVTATMWVVTDKDRDEVWSRISFRDALLVLSRAG